MRSIYSIPRTSQHFFHKTQKTNPFSLTTRITQTFKFRAYNHRLHVPTDQQKFIAISPAIFNLKFLQLCFSSTEYNVQKPPSSTHSWLISSNMFIINTFGVKVLFSGVKQFHASNNISKLFQNNNPIPIQCCRFF